MDLWKARTDAIAYLSAERAAQTKVLEDIFQAIDICIDAYESKSGEDTYTRICGLTLLKGKHLGVGAFSLILDGLAQEAGALLRPFIEYTELLTYFRTFPEMVDKAANNNLPQAGERAKAVNGIYKDFRNHLNSHASHSSYSHFSLSHLLQPQTLKFKKLQRTDPEVLGRNLRNFTTQLYLLLHEAVLSLEQANTPEFAQLAEQTESLRERLIQEFGLNVV
ncbi:hypothetical protein ACYZTL_26385 [Pseudomonas sp. LB3P81]